MRTLTRSTTLTLFVLVGILLLATFFAARVLMEKYATAHKTDIAAIQSDAQVGYKDLAGTSVNLADYEDTPLIVNAWATWSPFSATELVMLAKLKQEYGDAFEVIAINRKESPATMSAYLSQIGNTEGITFLQDETDQFFTTVTGFAMPESVFYNKKGNIVSHVRGTMTETDMRAKIEVMFQNEGD